MINDTEVILIETDVIETQVSDGVLQLSYAFYPVPNPIRASLGGANPVSSTCGLQVIISNAALDSVTLSQLTITIPTGDKGDTGAFSTSALPAPQPASQPTADGKDTWLFANSGDVITIQTQSGQPANFTLSTVLFFTLPGIVINEAPGTVQLSITETAPPSPPVTDDNTYTLLKLPADFPVINFYAKPAMLYELDQSTTLYWECSDQGKQYSYSLHSDSWHPKDCLDGGNCYFWQDGLSGVTSPRLNDTTTFALDIIATDAKGKRTIDHTLYLPVLMRVPAVLNFYRNQKSYLSGHLFQLYWVTRNTTYCAIELDGAVLVPNAPTDTYQQGYILSLDLSVAGGAHQLQVVAYNEGGTPHPSIPIDITVSIHHPIPVGRYPEAIAITPDSTHALIVNEGDNTVSVLNLATLTVTHTIPVGDTPMSVAITPDGTRALIVNTGDSSIPYSSTASVLDLATLTVTSANLGGDGPRAIAITPNGTTALIVDDLAMVSVLNLATLTVPSTIDVGNSPMDIAITPDGTTALIANLEDNTVNVLNLATLTVTHTIPVGDYPMGIAITPNGTTALIVNEGDSTVSVLDLATLTVTNTITVDAEPVAITITPDGTTALIDHWVINPQATAAIVSVLDLATLTVPGSIQVSNYQSSLAITPDGTRILIADNRNNTVTVM